MAGVRADDLFAVGELEGGDSARADATGEGGREEVAGFPVPDVLPHVLCGISAAIAGGREGAAVRCWSSGGVSMSVLMETEICEFQVGSRCVRPHPILFRLCSSSYHILVCYKLSASGLYLPSIN